MLVKKFMLGNTTIEIHDDAYINRTQEEMDRSVKRIEEIASASYFKKLNKELESKDILQEAKEA